MRRAAGLVCSFACLAADPASAQDEPVRVAIHSGMALCKAWVEGIVAKKVTRPDFDADGFAATATPGVKLDRVASVPDAILPANARRFMTDYWHMDAGTMAGLFVVASRFVPVCHVVGGGTVDYQPLVQAELGASAFTADWQPVGHREDRSGDMASTAYRLAHNRRETLLVSSATGPGGRTDRAQFMSTFTYKLR